MKAAAAAAITLLLACTSVSRADGEPPYQVMRTLQNLQDRITTGDTVAAAIHAKTITQTADAFAATRPTAWHDQRNARALVLYLFSGGDAATIAGAIPSSAVPKDQQALYQGALAYGLGQDDKARKILGAIDARSVPSGLGGHLALVQASLFANADKPRAIALLDLARLLEPGTLVEEAALRKEMLLIDAGEGDLGKFTALARRYAGSFPRSLYFTNFRQLLTEAAIKLGTSSRADAGARLRSVVTSLSAPERRRLLLAVARNALLSGRLDMAMFASDEAGRLARKGELDEARALVVYGAAAIAGPQYELGQRALAEAGRATLDSDDQALRQSALAVAAMIRSPSFTAKPMRGDAETELLKDGDRAIDAADASLQLASK